MLSFFKAFAFPFPKFSYRQWAYLATVITGFASLCAQVAWQKYLTVLVGSEIRSISLVVAIFLLGLAVGYYVFGKITEKGWARRRLLKVYGYVELATAVYISVFYLYFEFLKILSFNSPAYFLSDIFISVLALFLPTFLMGASLPVLTAVLPAKSEEVNAAHVKIYGWNTLGAFLGVLVSGFYLLPAFGLAVTLTVAGAVNFIAGLIFMGNKLEGNVHRRTHFPSFPSRLPNWFYVVFAFLAGAIVISFEVLFVRLLNLSLGAGVYNFPIVLSLFVGGLALGSLSIKAQKISTSFFIRQILITAVFLALLFITSPYWGVWINHGRVSLLSIPSNYFVFKIFVYLFVGLALLPAVFFMGRLLPLAYALLKKNQDNYGAICGYLYFFNTLGTVFGTIVIGYLAFYIFDLEDIFKINLALLILLSLTASFYEKKGWPVVFSALLVVCFFFLPPWDRSGHHLGYFRIRSLRPDYFKKLFSLPKVSPSANLLFFDDGPDVSVSLLGYKGDNSPRLKKLLPVKKFERAKNSPPEVAKNLPPSERYSAISFVVNGKAIGNSLGDFSTMFLAGSLAYLHAPERAGGLSSAVIGLGTGISAGVLARLDESREMTVLEIAPEVVDNVRRAPSFSFNLMSNPKAKIIKKDGFKYFTRAKKKFDLIVSTPSNPWVVGVENVFSYEFYKIAKKSMAKDGVLTQWAQLYSIDFKTLKIMFHTIKKVFPYARLYRVGARDIAIVASSAPLKRRFSEKRFFDPVLIPYHKALGFHQPEDLILAQIFSESLFSKISKSNKFGTHTLTAPKLAYRGDKTFFSGQLIEPENLAPGYLFDSPLIIDQKIRAFKKYVPLSAEKIKERCEKLISFFCGYLAQARFNQKAFEQKDKSPVQLLNNYIYLRRRGLIKHQDGFLSDLKKELLEKKIKSRPALWIYLNQLLSRGQYETAQKEWLLFKKKELLTKESFDEGIKHIDDVLREISK